MVNIGPSGEIVSTDILIIGGGMSGLSAAIAVKEQSPQTGVLIVEKATSGYAGKAPKGGGIFAFVTPEDTVDEFVQYHVERIGCYLEDQELLHDYAAESAAIVKKLDTWGVNFIKQNGEVFYVKPRGAELPWGLASADLDMCVRLHRRAKKLGVRFIDQTCIVDLTKQDGQVVGAIGFNVINGSPCVIRSKATILANGGQNYRIMPMWSPGRGDGVAAAYRAGAEMRNAEFGSFVNIIYRANQLVVFNSEDALINAKGEHFSKKYRPHPELEPDICCKAVVGWYKEVAAGNGPIVVDPAEEDSVTRPRLTSLAEYSDRRAADKGNMHRPRHTAFRTRLRDEAMQVFKDDSPREVTIGFIGELGSVRVNHQMATTIPGLFAIGDVSYGGSALAGAVPAPPGRMRGSGLMNAVFTGLRAAAASLHFIAGQSGTLVPRHATVQELQNNMLAPLRRNSRAKPIDVVYAVQEAISPVQYSNWKHQDRMRQALSMVLEAKKKLPELMARDTHELAACHEAHAMVLCAEIFYRTALERKESRGWFLREDYQQADDKNWLKWIVAKDVNSRMVLSTEAVPIQRYPFKPAMFQAARANG